MNLIKRIFKKQTDEQYLKEHGFVHGENFTNYSWGGLDSNYPWLIRIGNNVTISTNVTILSHDASTNRAVGHTKVGIVSIGNNVFIGTKATILCNVRIGDNVIIGAGSIVCKDIPSNCVVSGNPAKVIGTYDEFINKHKNNLDNHMIFSQHSRVGWKEANPDEWEKMYEELSKTHGYI